MRIGILSTPMLFQRDAALQQQVRATIGALNQIASHGGQPMTVELADPNRTRLADYDLIHVFSATHGNHRIVEEAAEQGVPVVLTPLISPGWNRDTGQRARAGDHGFGSLTSWNVQTGYAQTRRALQQASLIVALGEAEKQAIGAGFLVDASKVRVFPNGISPHFFTANGSLFRQRTGFAGAFALMVGPISPYTNALGMAQALAELGMPLVLIGETRERDQDYLRQVRQVPGVTCMGGLQHDGAMLASAYAAASVFVLPSQGALFPLQVLEALATGTPVVMTSETALSLPDSAFALAKVRWDDSSAQQCAVATLLGAEPPRERVQALVRGFTWQRLADQIAACYVELLTPVAAAA